MFTYLFSKLPFFKLWHLAYIISRWLLLISCLVLTLEYYLAPTAFAQTPSPIDIVFAEDFSGDLSKWQPIRDQGQYWKVAGGRLEVVLPARSMITELVPKDEFWNSNWKNIEYEMNIKPLEGADRNISFYVQNKDNWHEVHYNNDAVWFEQVRNGVSIWNQGRGAALQNGQTYHLKIRIEKNKFQVWVNSNLVTEEINPKYNQESGKIGLKASTGSVYPTRIVFDDIKVRLLSNENQNSLSIAPLKQTDQQWKDLEYDHAQAWSSQSTIGRWGCALTSLVMIMKFHAITKLPNGETLTPATLNAWLKSQPDGYIGQGALNWLAATRLTKIISDVYHTPKLEYKRINSGSLTSAQQELTFQRPVILEIPGHFLVANGVINNGLDLAIIDPAYIFTKFSQHKTAPLSTRTFLPSQTDLSYFLLAHKPGLTTKLTNSANEELSEFESFTDTITDHLDLSGEETPPLIQHQLIKPNPGTYTLAITQPSLQPYEFELYVYDQAGNPSISKRQGWLGPHPLHFSIEYFKEKPSIITPKVTLKDWELSLKVVKNARLFTKTTIAHTLEATIKNAQTAPTAQIPRYLTLLRTQLHQYRSFINPAGYNYLLQQLDYLSQQV